MASLIDAVGHLTHTHTKDFPLTRAQSNLDSFARSLVHPSIPQGERSIPTVSVSFSVRGEACLPSVRQVSNHKRKDVSGLFAGSSKLDFLTNKSRRITHLLTASISAKQHRNHENFHKDKCLSWWVSSPFGLFLSADLLRKCFRVTGVKLWLENIRQE